MEGKVQGGNTKWKNVPAALLFRGASSDSLESPA